MPPSSGLGTVRFELPVHQEEMSGTVTAKAYGDITEHLNLIADFCEDFPPCVHGAMPFEASEKSVGRLYAMVSLCFRRPQVETCLNELNLTFALQNMSAELVTPCSTNRMYRQLQQAVTTNRPQRAD